MGKRKRVSGEGTYKKRKDGRWEAQYTVYTPYGTKRKSVYGRTKQEVAEKLRKAVSERDSGLAFDAVNRGRREERLGDESEQAQKSRQRQYKACFSHARSFADQKPGCRKRMMQKRERSL